MKEKINVLIEFVFFLSNVQKIMTYKL